MSDEPKIVNAITGLAKYECEVHGELENNIEVRIPDYKLNGLYCMKCILEKYIADIPKLKKVKIGSKTP